MSRECRDNFFDLDIASRDSNLRMAESKSSYFACFIKTYSAKFAKFDHLPINRLAQISECRHHLRTSKVSFKEATQA
jgi:hypothetical protein